MPVNSEDRQQALVRRSRASHLSRRVVLPRRRGTKTEDC